MSGLAKLKAFIEKGMRNKASDQASLNAAHDAIVSAGAECASMAESASFSNNDIHSLLSKAIKDYVKANGTYSYAYITDIYDDYLVYNSDYDSTYQKVDYTVNDSGVVTLGTPIAVVRKVTYQEPVETLESAEIELTSDSVELVERAVNENGVTMLKLISPGIGSSGYYSEEVLKRDGPKVFKKGLHNLIDHPTAQESAARPEGSIDKLGSALLEDATWKDSYIDTKGRDHGKGLYAKAQVVPDFAPKLNTIAENIGTSIRASGKARKGMINGVEMPIIESIENAKSVDYVTLPGRGGKVIELMESLRIEPIIGEVDMAIDEKEFNEVKEQNRTMLGLVESLRGELNRNAANALIERGLTAFPTLPQATKRKVSETMATAVLPLTEAGTLDAAKLTTMLKDQVTAETSYLASIGVGHVKGLGSIGALEESEADLAEFTYEKFSESLKD